VSGNQPTGFVLTVTPPVRHCMNRLRLGLADTAKWPDSELLELINEGYASMCTSLRYLRRVSSFPLIAGQREYGLPAGTVRVFRVYVDGIRLEPVPYTEVNDGDTASYYQEDGNIGFVTTPQVDGAAWLYYAISPTPLGLDDTPLIPPECYYLLRHYAAWRIIMVQGGAQRIVEAERQHRMFTDGIKKLRREMTPQAEAAAQNFQVAWENAV
jgi:hypothetical protein